MRNYSAKAFHIYGVLRGNFIFRYDHVSGVPVVTRGRTRGVHRGHAGNVRDGDFRYVRAYLYIYCKND